MKKNKAHSVKYNFIMNCILNASSFIFPLITFPYTSRVLLAEGNGKISFYSSVANYFLLVASLGIPTYGIRACARVRDNEYELSKTVKEIFVINEIMTTLVIITYGISFFLVQRFQQEPELFLMNGVGIALNMFSMNWFFQALEQYDYITVRSMLIKLISVFLMFLLVHNSSDYKIMAGISIVANSGFNVLNFFRAKKYVNFGCPISELELKKHFKPILILFAQSLAVSVYTNLDTVMLGFLKNDTEVGYYNAAVKLKYVLLSLVSSLGQVLLPRMSYFVRNKQKKEFIVMMSKAFNFTLALALPVAVYFSMYSSEVMLFLAGDGYIGAVFAMQVITVAIIPNGLTGILGTQVLTSLEKEKYVLYSVLVGAVSDFILNILFIPKYGATGAALATMICEFLVLFMQVFFCKDLLKIIAKDIHCFRYLIATSVSTVASLSIKFVSFGSVFLRLVLSCLIFFIVYSVCLIIVKDEFVLQIIREVKSFKSKIKNSVL